MVGPFNETRRIAAASATAPLSRAAPKPAQRAGAGMGKGRTPMRSTILSRAPSVAARSAYCALPPIRYPLRWFSREVLTVRVAESTTVGITRRTLVVPESTSTMRRLRKPAGLPPQRA
jgi:hypothetical protein